MISVISIAIKTLNTHVGKGYFQVGTGSFHQSFGKRNGSRRETAA
jgi:hypothetical protein